MTAIRDQLSHLLSEELTFVGLDVPDRWTAIRLLGEALHRGGFVHDDYVQAVIEREKIFPTGLPTSPVGVAIPHAGVQYCRRPAIAVAVLARPVPWIEMATLDRELSVQIVLALSITDPDTQVSALRSIVDLFGEPQRVAELLGLTAPREVVQFLNGAAPQSQPAVETTATRRPRSQDGRG